MIPVHLYGHPADMDALGKLAARRKLKIVEEDAIARLARYMEQHQDQSEFTVEEVERALKFPRTRAVHVMKTFAASSSATFVTGRKGHPSRLCAYNPDSNTEKPTREAEPLSSVGEDARIHRLWLREQVEISLTLPRDLTQAETEKLSEWVRLLATGAGQ